MEVQDGGHLGRIAVQKGFITEQQLEECLREQRDLQTKGQRLQLGQILIKKRLITTEQFLQLMSYRGVSESDTQQMLVLPDDTGLLRALTFAPGTLIGHYRIIKDIGQGGMGFIFQAEDTRLNRIVALKILKMIEGGEDDVMLRRFLQEAKLTAKLHHPYIVTIYEADVHNGVPYFAMEYIEGRPLEELIADDGVELRTLVEILRKTAEGVAYAHAQGIIHRDLKPLNVLVDTQNNPHILDFGLARHVQGSTIAGRKITQYASRMGTPFYMSPEQVSGPPSAVDHRADVWGLGVMLYEAMTQRLPFDGVSDAQVYERILTTDPVPPRRIDRSIPRDLELVCLKALEKDKLRRYPSAADFAEELARFLRGEPVKARRASVMYRLSHLVRRHARIIIAVAGSVLISVLSTLYFTVVVPVQHERQAKVELERAREATRQLREAIQRRVRDVAEAVLKADRLGLYEQALERAARFREAFGRYMGDPFHIPNSSEVLGPVEVPMDQVELAAAHAHQALGHSEQAIAGYVRAYWLAGKNTSTAAQSLFQLGTHLLELGDAARARSILAVLLERFADTGRHGEAALALARACHELGEIAAARTYYQQALQASVAGRSEAQKIVELIDALFPARELAMPSGQVVMADVDRDGRSEVVHLDVTGTLTLHAVSREGLQLLMSTPAMTEEQRAMGGTVVVGDADGDGAEEILTAWAHPDRDAGEISIFKIGNANLLLHARQRFPAALNGSGAIDFDGDGLPELALLTGAYERKLRVLGKGRTLEYPLGSDPEFLVPAEGGLAVLSLGPWSSFRLSLVRVTPEQLQVIALMPKLCHARDPVLTGRDLYFANVMDEHVLAALQAKTKGILPRGTYRVRFDRNGFEEPQKLFDEPLSLKLWNGRFVWRRGRWLEISASLEEPARTIRFPITGRIMIANVDDDPEPEICVWRESGTLTVLGDASAGKLPATRVAAPEQPDRSGEPLLQAAREILGMGFAAAAEEMFAEIERRSRGTPEETAARLGVASCRMERGAYREAAELFHEIARQFPQVQKECALKRIHCFEQLQDWRGLLEACRETLQRVALEPFERRQVEGRADLAERLLGMRPQLLVTPATLSGVEGLVTHPLSVSMTDDGLVLVGNSGDPTVVMLPFRYDGDSFRLVADLSFEKLEWGTGFALSLTGAPDGAKRSFAPGVSFVYSGAYDLPVFQVQLTEGTAANTVVAQMRELPDPARTYHVTMEYIRDLDLLRVSAPGLIPGDGLSLKTVQRISGESSCLTLRCGGEIRADLFWSTVRLRSLQFESRSAVNRWMPVNSNAPLVQLSRARWQMVAGHDERAEAILRGLTSDPLAGLEAKLYAAVAAFRRKAEGAERLAQQVMALSPGGTLTFLKRHCAALSRPQLAFLAEAVWSYLIAADETGLKALFNGLDPNYVDRRLADYRGQGEGGRVVLCLELLAQSYLDVWKSETCEALRVMGEVRGYRVQFDGKGEITISRLAEH